MPCGSLIVSASLVLCSTRYVLNPSLRAIVQKTSASGRPNTDSIFVSPLRPAGVPKSSESSCHRVVGCVTCKGYHNTSQLNACRASGTPRVQQQRARRSSAALRLTPRNQSVDENGVTTHTRPARSRGRVAQPAHSSAPWSTAWLAVRPSPTPTGEKSAPRNLLLLSLRVMLRA